MRTHSSRSLYTVLCTLLTCTLIIGILAPCLRAADEPTLQVMILNLEETDQGENVMYEGSSYNVYIGVTGGLSFVSGVTITVPWATYLTTNETPVLYFTAPLYEDQHSFTMTASKDGYLPANMTITILRGSLHITTASTSIKEGSEVTVTITDQRGVPIDAAAVKMRGETVASTNAAGKATLTAPEVPQDQDLVLSATKDGYVYGTKTLVVSNIHSQLFTINLSQTIPILVALVAVIVAVGLVRWRQTHPSLHRKNPPEDPEGSRLDFSLETTKEASSPKVEEIRIPLMEKKKETTFLTRDKEPTHTTKDRTVSTEDWFQGTDYTKFKLDELTGKIDAKREGKWFVGEDDIESKVDEALKKKTTPKKPNTTRTSHSTNTTRKTR
jgi:hypothetical protein